MLLQFGPMLMHARNKRSHIIFTVYESLNGQVWFEACLGTDQENTICNFTFCLVVTRNDTHFHSS